MRSSGSHSVRTRAMSSSSFAPLAEAVPRVFRPFGAPPAEAAAEPAAPAPAPAPGPSAEEICYQRELLELALGVARKVVQQELAERPEIWLGMIRAAAKRAVDRERITLRVPAPLMAFLRGSLAALRASLEDVKDLELVEDPGLPAGGCVIESRSGELDIGVETQLERCERALVRATE